MQTISTYINEYAESHQNKTNQMIHVICVPLITWSILGVLHTFKITENLYGSHAFILFALVYYSFFKRALIVASMALFSGLILFSFQFIPNLLIAAIVVFVLAWIGQFYGHHVEGKRPSFLKDLTFLLIGPIWTLKKAFPRIDSY